MRLIAISTVSAIALLGACSQADQGAVAAEPQTVVEETAETVVDAIVEKEAEDTAAMEAAAALLAETSAATYDVEKTHAFLFWKVDHAGGLSSYIAKFKNWDATIEFDPSDVTASKVTATIDPTSVETDHPSKADEWHEELANDFFKAVEFPEITFESTAIETTGPMTGTMTGDLTFLGITKPVTMDVTFNGVGNMPWFGERDLIGFDATTTFKRSDFGLTKMIDIGIGDEVTVSMSAEFLERPAEDAAE